MSVDLKHKKVNFKKLIKFGFEHKNDNYVFFTDLSDGQFLLKITISIDGNLKTKVTDKNSGDVYTLHLVEAAEGEFVGKIRDEYNTILDSIIESCFEPDVFKTLQAQEIIEFIRTNYESEPEYLWEKFSNNAVFRRNDNRKWFAILLIIPKTKLNISEEGNIEIIDLRMYPHEKETLIDYKKYYPGYHMNKNSWFTIPLDGSVCIDEIFSRIECSHSLAMKKSKNKKLDNN